MILLVNAKINFYLKMSKYSDFSYAWIYIQDYKYEIKKSIGKDYKNSLLLKAILLKMATLLNLPLIRIFEIKNDDIENITNYFIEELIKVVIIILKEVIRKEYEYIKDEHSLFEFEFIEKFIIKLKEDFQKYTKSIKRYHYAKIILEEEINNKLFKSLEKSFQKYIGFNKMDFTQKLNKFHNL